MSFLTEFCIYYNDLKQYMTQKVVVFKSHRFIKNISLNSNIGCES